MTKSYAFTVRHGRSGQTYWACTHRNGKSVAIGGEGKRRPGEALTQLRRLLAAIERGDYTVTGLADRRRRA